MLKSCARLKFVFFICQDGGDAGIALRGLFIIDAKGNLRSSIINDLPVGRNPEEVLRLVQAFQFTGASFLLSYSLFAGASFFLSFSLLGLFGLVFPTMYLRLVCTHRRARRSLPCFLEAGLQVHEGRPRGLARVLRKRTLRC